MNYLEIKVSFSPAEPWKDIFTSLLGEAGCDSFIDGENENELLSYIKEENYDPEQIKRVLTEYYPEIKVEYTVSKVENQNWNAVWESNYSPVLIAEKCHIRAPFHETLQGVDFEIIIEPKMSFGTAHHETTSLMIEYLLEEDLKGKKVLDMGAGTGILAILASKKGAASVLAVDNDEWAYLNNLENNEKNSVSNIEVKLGDAASLKGEYFDVIIANINRNILLNDIPAYSESLKKNGILYLSGFYQGDDLEAIQQKCAQYNLRFTSCKEKNNWVAARFDR